MSEQGNSSYPDDWLAVARRDRARANLHLREDDLEAAAFFLQQSLEKFLKAYLLGHGWELRKTHELDALLEEAA